ncbi:hypothetical protein INT45_007723 [Circinella minor]|uniref:Uncharacterized protein n=1 Tax=Circinella minor TaxID=1195481 RepID=A0A8H7RXE3_9FUNG|nr:hypothetical protein INT45_007723 [Circinella minor]
MTPFYQKYVVVDQDKNVAVRWANKASDEATDIRPDAVISTLIQHDYGYFLGFNEVKVGNSSTTKHNACKDILKLGIAAKRVIDKWKLETTIYKSTTTSRISRCFWNYCKTMKDVDPEQVDGEQVDGGDNFVVPISKFYGLIDKSSNKSLAA